VRERALRRLLVAAAVAATIAGYAHANAPRTNGVVAPLRPSVAIDPRGFPRTYHIYGGEGRPGSLARYDMVVGYAYWNLRALRARNPNGIFLLNPGLRPNRPADYQGLSVTYGSLSQWRGGYDRIPGGPALGRIRPFAPYWDQLYDADGSPALVNDTYHHGGWNLAHVGVPDLVARVFAHASKLDGLYTKGWDGVHSDNWIYRIGIGWFYGSSLDSDRDGRVDDYTRLRRNWAAGLTRVGRLLRSYLPGKIVGGNGNWNVVPGRGTIDFRLYLARPDDYLRSANYTLLEGLELYAGQEDDLVGWVGEWLRYPDPENKQRYFAILHKLPGGAPDYQSLRWGLSLGTIAGAYYEAYAGSHDDRLWYDEYDGGEGVRRRQWLGKPLSGPQKLADGLWRRDFEHGVVLNNSTTSAQTVTLGAAFRRLRGTQDPSVNDGARVTEVAIPPRDGLFLIRAQ
jgi:Hypothetical glycosyl hydrolase family 15